MSPTFSRREARSPYMEWAKLQSEARYNLATSGVSALPLAELDVALEHLELAGPSGYGHPPLLEAIARRYQVPVDCVTSAIGTSYANYLALAAVTEPGDEILVEEPTYELILSAARYLGLEIRRFQRRAEDAFAVDPDEVKKNLGPRTRLIVICNLHNPTGALVPDETLRTIGRHVETAGARVLVDEVYKEMLFEDAPETAFRLDPERFMVTNSLTKAYGLSGLRCGWVLAEPRLVQRMRHIDDLHGATFVHLAELLSVVAFEKLPAIARRTEAALCGNRELLREFLRSRDDLEYVWPDFGTIVFPRWKGGDAAELIATLREKFEVTVAPGEFFERPEHFRIGVGLPIGEVRAGLVQLGHGLDAMRKRTPSEWKHTRGK